MRKIYIYGAIGIAVVLLLVATALYLRGATIPILEPAGPIAAEERWVIVITILLCAIVVIPVFVLLFLFAWKYRASRAQTEETHRPEWDHASVFIEFTWWLIPTAIIAVLSVILWQSAHALDPYKKIPGATSLEVDVVALDWKWLFMYPSEGVASVNLLEIPTNVPVTFKITADAPMNSFWIPQLGGQIMAMPGMVTQLNLMASRNGTYDGFSANISGDGFAGMNFKTTSVSQSDFDAWVESIRDASSTPLSLASYAALAKPSEYNPVATYAPVDADLYGNIVMKYMMPNPNQNTVTSTSSVPVSTTTSATATTSTPMPAPNSVSGSGMSGMNMTMP